MQQYKKYIDQALEILQNRIPDRQEDLLLSDHNGYTILHLLARFAVFPKSDAQWSVADNEGWSVAHEAALYHGLPENFPFYHLTTDNGQSVEDVTLCKATIRRNSSGACLHSECDSTAAESWEDNVELYRYWAIIHREYRPFEEPILNDRESLEHLESCLKRFNIADEAFEADLFDDSTPDNGYKSFPCPEFLDPEDRRCFVLTFKNSDYKRYSSFRETTQSFLDISELFDETDTSFTKPLNNGDSDQKWASLFSYYSIYKESALFLHANIVEVLSRMLYSERLYSALGKR